MTRNTVYTYIRFTEGKAEEQSAKLLQRALFAFWKKTGLAPEEILRTGKGKPYFPSGRLYLSVTHTGNLFVCSFATRPIGIDAEKKAENRPHIGERKFSDEERDLPFSYVWCAKEAVAKLTGEGLAALLRVKVKKDRGELDGIGYALHQQTLGAYLLVTATEEGWNYGAETLSEE